MRHHDSANGDGRGPETLDLGYELTEGFAGRYIRRKARQLAGKSGFTECDREDIEQQLTLKLIERLPAFDPSKSHLNAFVATIVERCAATLARKNTAAKRDSRRACHLSTVVDYDDNGPVELGELVGQDEDDARRLRTMRESYEEAELHIDVAEVLASLTDDERDLCERLMYRSVSEMARELGVPRSTLRNRLRRLRERFEQAGLREHL